MPGGLAVQNASTDETVERLQRAVESAFDQMYEHVRAGGGYSSRVGLGAVLPDG